MSLSLCDIMEYILNFKNNKKEWEKKNREKEKEWEKIILCSEFIFYKGIFL